MCLSVPARVMDIHEDTATVSVGGTVMQASLLLLDGVTVGDYVLVHAGFAMTKLDETEAEKSLALFQSIAHSVDTMNDEN